MLVRDFGRRHIGWFDVHVPHQSPLEQPLGFAHDSGCDHFIIGGDFLNLEWASHWNEKMFKAVGLLKHREMLEKEVEDGVKVISEIRKAIGKKAKLWYVPGNHEAWLFYACFYHSIFPIPFHSKDIHYKSDVADMLNKGLSSMLTVLLQAKKFNMHVLDYNDPLKIGKLVYMHGHQFGTKRPTNQSISRYPGINLVMGHHHKHEVTPGHNSGNPKDNHEHVIVPALTKLSPGYLKDKSTTWCNGFWLADFQKDGLFDGRVKKVFSGKIIPSA